MTKPITSIQDKRLSSQCSTKVILTAIRAWTEEQHDKITLQWLLGTTERVKKEFYNCRFDAMATTGAFLETFISSKLKIG